MATSIPTEMKAAAFDRFGGPDVLHLETLPVPRPKKDEVLIRIDAAGIGVWDPYVRQGEFEIGRRAFPKVIGNDGAGEVVAVGKEVKRFKVGDRVYAYAMEGGFYAQFVAVKEEEVAPLPPGVDIQEAGALGADGVTALRGLEDQLHLRPGESLLVFGASGGIGHLAVQLAKRIAADVRVFAVASGPDGVALARKLGADAAVDGRREEVVKAARAFAPNGFDAALILAGASREVLATIREGGRLAFPHGVEPEPQAPKGVDRLDYDGEPGWDALARLNQLIERGPFHVELSHVYPLDQAAQAHRDVEKHHLGKLALRVRA